MSGILGILQRDGAPVDRSLLCSLVRTFSDYAPDAQNVWVAGTVGLAHALLSTTPESVGESQPASMDGRFWITADARLDARADLEYELASTGHTCRQNAPDSELLLHAYAAWGESCVHHLRGDFSFAIWDARETRLFCARDHFGIKPFYYGDFRDRFVFSNSLDCLRLFPGISEELNDQAIADFLLFGINHDLGSTTFCDIHRLPPAHSLSVSNEKLSIQRFWSPPIDGHIRYRNPDEYVEHFQLLLRAAVADRVRLSRVGVLLSGGLDSSSVTATARDIFRNGGTGDLRAYTVTYESLLPERDGHHARELAAFFDIPIRCLPMDDLKFFERWDDPQITCPEPVDDPFFAGLFDQMGAVASECRVVLSGEGMDNLMHFQMWPYVRDRIRRREWYPVLREVASYWRMRPSIWPGLRRRVRGLFKQDLGALAFPRWIAGEFVERLNLEERWHQRTLARAPRPHPLLPEAYESLVSPLWSRYFELQSAGVTRSLLEVRFPFLDLRIVDYLLALPPFPWAFNKTLLREAMLGHLPENIRLRKKTPLPGEPLVEKLRRTNGAWLDEAPWNDEIDRYIDRSALPHFASDRAHEPDAHARAWMDIRPLCLNFWLQSFRSVRYNRYAEAHDG